MEVNKIVVHYLNKTENQQRAEADLSQALLSIDGRSIDLITRLSSKYKDASISYAMFDDSEGKIFPKEFKDYLNRNSDQSFLHFSCEAVKHLRDGVVNIAPAKGGFLVFSDYEIDNRKYVSVYLVRDTIGMLFRKDKTKSSYTINPAEHLDLEKLAMGCNIDLNRYQLGDGRYLTFIKGTKLDDVSAYFINWISIKERESNRVFTENLYELVKQVDLPSDENGKEMPRNVFKSKVYDYINSAPSKTINVRELSDFFYSNRTYLADFAEKSDLLIDTEFRPDNN